MRIHESATRFARLISICATAVGLSSCETTAVLESQPPGDDFSFGVMVMAHGGGDEWNAHLVEAVEPLRANFPVEVAFGMADAGSMQDAVRRLESQGVRQVGVVRVFVSGESWYDRTLQILGLQGGAPSWADRDQSHEGHAMVMPMGFWKVDTELAFHVSVEGLADAVEMDEVLTTRIRGLSSDPANEVVAVIAHGPGDDAENQRWVEKITQRTRNAREELGLRDIRVFTLREDWPEKRPAAERAIQQLHCAGEFPRVDADRGAIPSAGIRPLRARVERTGLSGGQARPVASPECQSLDRQAGEPDESGSAGSTSCAGH